MKSELDKEYISSNIDERLGVLRNRYYMYCEGENEWMELSKGSAAQGRTRTIRDIHILLLVEELISHIDHNFVLGEEAAKGYEALVEPIEKHRRHA
jgi:hypothetical protein